MDQVKFDQLKRDISGLNTQTEQLSNEIEKFCFDPSVTEENIKDLTDAFREARGHSIGAYTIAKARWQHKIKGREFNAKVFVEKYLGKEVNVDPKSKEDSLDGVGIVSGYIQRPGENREYPYVIVELPAHNNTKLSQGHATVGVFRIPGPKVYAFLRAVYNYYYWAPEELVLVDNTPQPITTGECECGAIKSGGGLHSQWCPKY